MMICFSDSPAMDVRMKDRDEEVAGVTRGLRLEHIQLTLNQIVT